MLTYTPAMNSFLRFLFLVFVSSHSIQAVEPLISSLLPRGAMRDSEQQVVVRGQRLDKAAEFFFYSEGIEVSKIVEEKSTSIKATFSISDKAAFGQHKLRIRTNEGLSNLYTFWVGPFPNDPREEPNSAFDSATILLNSTVNGLILNEGVDYFEINATKGQRISVEIEAIRLSGLSLIHMSLFLTTALRTRHLRRQRGASARHLEHYRPEGRSLPNRGSRFLLQRSQQLPVPFARRYLPPSWSYFRPVGRRQDSGVHFSRRCKRRFQSQDHPSGKTH